MKRIISIMLAALVLAASFSACGKEKSKNEKKELMILAAASLTDVCGKLKEDFEKNNKDITLTFSFGASGALQAQIEEGAGADVFMSASLKQMTALDEKNLLLKDSVKELLENKIVLIVSKGNEKDIKSFDDLKGDKVSMVALGEPDSVPVGQYAEEILTNLGILEEVKKKANYGSDVRQVLTWVENGDVSCGVVYATDAFTTDKAEIVSYAPEGSCKRVIYPVGIVEASKNKDAAKKFVEYLSSDAAMRFFEEYGFIKP